MKYTFYKNFIFLVGCMLICAWAYADTSHDFDKKEKAYYQFIKNIRCVTCQNQSIADSYAPVAITMRQEIHNYWQKDLSPEEIKLILVNRYGEYVLLEPSFTLKNFFIWFLPFLISSLGIIGILKILR